MKMIKTLTLHKPDMVDMIDMIDIDNPFTITIEMRPYILNGTIQAVYRYHVNGQHVLTYYTNGRNTKLYPVYHALETWPRDIL